MNSVFNHFLAWRDSVSEEEFLEVIQSNPHLQDMIDALSDLVYGGPDPDEV